ncbi:hypothetical protein [Neogemmobacter tilapiae]|uniref:Uncharacterized protein n=1 Tax=Neogemmobacter tilapiae TaxID=875041 RepID=A0A918WLM1_9RHOB|nr:hypothetical protein [Gemmobacter tilapiae]GHC58212.1 hypothetical protein GCM10007315_22250 [Gemmobacter tilapiae]
MRALFILSVTLLSGCVETQPSSAPLTKGELVASHDPNAEERGYATNSDGSLRLVNGKPEVIARLGSKVDMISVSRIGEMKLSPDDYFLAKGMADHFCEITQMKPGSSEDGTGLATHAYFENGVWEFYRLCH